jgi:hypothetical protein
VPEDPSTFPTENQFMFRFLTRSLPRSDRRTVPTAGRARPPRLGAEPLEDRSVPAALSFAATAYDVGPWATAVSVGDFNHDGHPDLAACTSSWPRDSVSVLLGRGDGTFGPEANFPSGAYPRQVSIGDFNGDGNPDLVTNNSTFGVSVLLGKGDGTFGPKTDFPTGLQPMSIAVGDFNGDGKQDLATANAQNVNAVSVLLGNGDGTFAPKTDFAVGASPNMVAVGDFNQDGKQDLVTANVHSSSVSVLLGNGDGSFAPKTDFTAGSFARAVAIGDFNRDGKQDLVTGNTGSVSVLLGQGDGTFAPKVDVATVSVVESVAVADFDGNGKQDLITTDWYNHTVSVLPGGGDGTFAAPVSFAAGTVPVAVAVGDFNGDGKPDVVAASTGVEGSPGNLTVLLNTTIWTAAEGIDRVSDELGSIDLPGDVAQSLSSKLNAAQSALDAGNVGAARNLIESTIRQLENLVRAGQLDSAEADPLIADLQAALALL